MTDRGVEMSNTLQNIGDALTGGSGVVVVAAATLPDTTPGSLQQIGLAIAGTLLAVGRLAKALGDRQASK